MWFEGTSSPSYFGPSSSSPPRPYLIFQLSILSAIFCFSLRFPDEYTKSLATSSESPSSSPSPWIGGLPVRKIQTITSYTFHAPRRSTKEKLRWNRTFMPLVSGLALRARLLSVFPLVLVARSANRKRTDIASDEKLSIKSRTDFIAADLAHLTAQMFCRFRLKQQKHETVQQTDQISYNARRLNRKQIRSSK